MWIDFYIIPIENEEKICPCREQETVHHNGKLLWVESNKKVTELSSKGGEQREQVHLLTMGINKKKQLDLGNQWQHFMEWFLIKCVKYKSIIGF